LDRQAKVSPNTIFQVENGKISEEILLVSYSAKAINLVFHQN
jgi:hypothetical protein